MRRGGAVAGAIVCAAAALVGGRGCSAGPATTSADAAAAPSDDSYMPWDGKGPTCVPPPRPPGVPDGWELYPDYDPCCGFYVPGASAPMPPPIAWESCGSSVVPSGVNCQVMRLDWTHPPATPAITYGSSGTVLGSRVLLQFDRVVGATASALSFYRVVADAEGPILNAFLETRSDVCTLSASNVSSDRYLHNVTEYKSETKGYFSGKTDRSPPDAVAHFAKPGSDAIVGPVGILEISNGSVFQLHPSSNFQSSINVWSAAQDNGLDQSWPFFFGDDLFWNASRSDRVKLHLWTQAGGVVDFIANGSSLNPAAGSLGTDGIDMTWLEGGGQAGDGGFNPASIMAAPYTTDPTKITKRRLRSEEGNAVGLSNFVVGCGYAARSLYDRIRVVRIADGRSWLLPDAGGWQWTTPHVLTCTELFAYVVVNGQPNLGRVRLDSLGPGDPPD